MYTPYHCNSSYPNQRENHSNTLVLQSTTAVKWQVNEQGSFKAKDNGQTLLLDGQSFAINVVHKNIAKINGIRSKAKIKFWHKSTVKAENHSRPTLTTETTGVTPPCISQGITSVQTIYSPQHFTTGLALDTAADLTVTLNIVDMLIAQVHPIGYIPLTNTLTTHTHTTPHTYAHTTTLHTSTHLG